ncbi:hypothetical protein LSTR_LSTR004904 [Laodelphax striatellus]|uniref:Deltamethrin resistance protein prag01 domain-containing protein n=1 Tax=Laodelphax striatellus TaxID=195883 RepID=A0A482XM52_LAOST|nr:hypothetical protein LSTR_LSTR004904 [Laodelphax striatellus]
MISSVVRPLARKVVSRSAQSTSVRQLAHEPAHKPGSSLMDQLPVPEGSWEADFKAKNAKYNMQLIAGIGVFIGTLAFGELNGFFYAGARLPELPKKN